MVTAATKSPFQTVVHAMAHHKMRAVRMDGVSIVRAKTTVVANHAVTNNAAIIAVVKAVVVTKAAAAITGEVRPVSATNAAGHPSPAENPAPTANAPAITGRSQQALVGIRML